MTDKSKRPDPTHKQTNHTLESGNIVMFSRNEPLAGAEQPTKASPHLVIGTYVAEGETFAVLAMGALVGAVLPCPTDILFVDDDILQTLRQSPGLVFSSTDWIIVRADHEGFVCQPEGHVVVCTVSEWWREMIRDFQMSQQIFIDLSSSEEFIWRFTG